MSSSSAKSIPTTPTSHANSTFSSASSTGNSGLEDIQYLLYLETLKRFKDDEVNIRRQVEENTAQYRDAKSEYVQWYCKYVKLVELCLTRNALENANILNDGQVALAKQNVDYIMEKITTNNITTYLTPEVVEACKQKLAEVKTHNNLRQLQQSAARHKADARAIQIAMETVETTVEMAIVQGLDHFISEVHMENFEKI